MSKVIVQKLGVTSKVFNCHDCDAVMDDYNTASNTALNHARRYGHKVTGELVSAVIYHGTVALSEGG